MESLIGCTIRFAGVPGSGKTTLGKSLCDFFNRRGISAQFFPERIDMDILNMYLDPKKPENRKKYAYKLQKDTLLKRIEDFEKAVDYSRCGNISLIDGPVFCDQAFEALNYQEGYITEEEHQEYQTLIKSIPFYFAASKKDPIVLLDCSPDTSIRRLGKRGNAREIKAYDKRFYQRINKNLKESLPDSTIILPYNIDVSILADDVLENILTYIISHLHNSSYTH